MPAANYYGIGGTMNVKVKKKKRTNGLNAALCIIHLLHGNG